MKLYHYSKEPFTELKISRLTKPRSKEEIDRIISFDKKVGREYGYLDHISFFFEPIPIDIGSLYKNIDHPIWKKDQILYEHVIHTLGMDFAFDLYETPQLIEFMDKNFKPEFNKPENEKQLIQYFKDEIVFMKKLGHHSSMGKSTQKLMDATSPFKGRTREFFLRTLALEKPEFLAKMYAPGVPHLFLYPKTPSLTLKEEPRQIVLF